MAIFAARFCSFLHNCPYGLSQVFALWYVFYEIITAFWRTYTDTCTCGNTAEHRRALASLFFCSQIIMDACVCVCVCDLLLPWWINVYSSSTSISCFAVDRDTNIIHSSYCLLLLAGFASYPSWRIVHSTCGLCPYAVLKSHQAIAWICNYSLMFITCFVLIVINNGLLHIISSYKLSSVVRLFRLFPTKSPAGFCSGVRCFCSPDSGRATQLDFGTYLVNRLATIVPSLLMYLSPKIIVMDDWHRALF